MSAFYLSLRNFPGGGGSHCLKHVFMTSPAVYDVHNYDVMIVYYPRQMG